MCKSHFRKLWSSSHHQSFQMWLQPANLHSTTAARLENKWSVVKSAQEKRGCSPRSVPGMFWLNWKPSFKLKCQHWGDNDGDRRQHPGLVFSCLGREHKRVSFLQFGPRSLLNLHHPTATPPSIQSVYKSDVRQLASLTQNIGLFSAVHQE